MGRPVVETNAWEGRAMYTKVLRMSSDVLRMNTEYIPETCPSGVSYQHVVNPGRCRMVRWRVESPFR